MCLAGNPTGGETRCVKAEALVRLNAEEHELLPQ
jgi:hypothetical protein